MNAPDKPPEPQYDRVSPSETEDLDGGDVPLEKPVSPRQQPSLANWQRADTDFHEQIQNDVAVSCGWGRLIFGHTFTDNQTLVDCLLSEGPAQRDVALYLRDPQVLVSIAPDQLFLDPSHTFRLNLDQERKPSSPPAGFRIRRLTRRSDADDINRLFQKHHMVPVDPAFAWRHRDSKTLTYLVAEDDTTSEIIGCVLGVDHVAAFGDPEGGSSLWTLAVDPDARHPRIGRHLILYLAEHFRGQQRQWMDLSVLATNDNAIALYEKLGFYRVPAFVVKRKHNPVNERLYIPQANDDLLNPYARIIADEARVRGIRVDIISSERNFLKLSYGGRSVTCWESLTGLTSAIAMVRCADKRLTNEVLSAAGLSVPACRVAGIDAEADSKFLNEHGQVVVKPLDSEQGRGITVDLRSDAEVDMAITEAKRHGDQVLLEQYVSGQDLRIVVINGEVVAAAIRRLPHICGDGQHSISELIQKLSRRRQASTGGESHIPIDDETIRVVRNAGHEVDDVLAENVTLAVRKTANLHTGATLHDCTDELHPTLRRAAIDAAKAIDIPVVGLDFLVPDPAETEYVIIEANERPGLANHEPRPTAQRFIDFLFPHSIPSRESSPA